MTTHYITAAEQALQIHKNATETSKNNMDLFKRDNSTSITFPQEVYLYDNIDHDFILGRDFTGSEEKIALICRQSPI